MRENGRIVFDKPVSQPIIMKRALKIIAAVTAVALLAVSCGVVSFTGRKQMLLFSDSEIMALSDESYAEFTKTATVSADVASTRELKEVGNKMVSALESYLKANGQSSVLSGLKWEFMLVNSAEVNAFCMPSGKIVFYEGILKYADKPDYIAVVMGHEMAHAIARHGNERMSQQSVMNLLGSAASEVIGNKKGAVAQNLFNIGFGIGSQAGVLLPYSRKHEYEADKIGMYIMDIAGYDVNAAPAFWKKMTDGKTSSQSDFLSTHPSDAKRIAALEEAIRTKPELK
ncbi:MAG: M48 family metallopeptidase [Bacteroidales bacterium]|nr:M48 family metallopeptidase [Bacteroidales bacterium]